MEIGSEGSTSCIRPITVKFEVDGIHVQLAV